MLLLKCNFYFVIIMQNYMAVNQETQLIQEGGAFLLSLTVFCIESRNSPRIS